jgi:hypothetical protein
LRAKEFQKFLDSAVIIALVSMVRCSHPAISIAYYSTRSDRIQVAFLAAFEIYFKFGMDSLQVFKDYDEGAKQQSTKRWSGKLEWNGNSNGPWSRIKLQEFKDAGIQRCKLH